MKGHVTWHHVADFLGVLAEMPGARTRDHAARRRFVGLGKGSRGDNSHPRCAPRIRGGLGPRVAESRDAPGASRDPAPGPPPSSPPRLLRGGAAGGDRGDSPASFRRHFPAMEIVIVQRSGDACVAVARRHDRSKQPSGSHDVSQHAPRKFRHRPGPVDPGWWGAGRRRCHRLSSAIVIVM